MSSIKRTIPTQAATPPSSSLWQRFKQAIGLEQPTASSLNKSDSFSYSHSPQSGTQLASVVVNLSRTGQGAISAQASQKQLGLSQSSLFKTQAIAGPHNWQSLFLEGTAPAKWPHQIQPASVSLQQLEQDGRLSQVLVDALTELSTAELSSDLSTQREILIQSVLQDIAAPETIMQGNKDTCVTTVGQIKLAIEDPVKYVRLMRSLVTGQGKPDFIPNNPAGETLRLKAHLAGDPSGRSLSNQLFQTALMEYGNGANTYNEQADLNTNPQRPTQTQSGLRDFENQNLMGALFAGEYQIFSLQQGLTPSVLAKRIENAVTAGVPISTGMRWGESGHQVLVVGMDPKQVLLINPQSMGSKFSMSRSDFEQHLLSAALPTKADPSLDQSQGLPGQIANAQTYQPLSDVAFLSPHEYLARQHASLPLELQNSLNNAWSKTGLQTRHFKPLEDVLSQQPQGLKAPFRDTLADLSSVALTPIAGGRGILKLNAFVQILWENKGSAGLEQANSFLQTLRQSGLQTVWSEPDKAQLLLEAARSGHLNPDLVQALKN